MLTWVCGFYLGNLGDACFVVSYVLIGFVFTLLWLSCALWVLLDVALLSFVVWFGFAWFIWVWFLWVLMRLDFSWLFDVSWLFICGFHFTWDVVICLRFCFRGLRCWNETVGTLDVCFLFRLITWFTVLIA